ncbi:MAG TPA: PqqD family protein [Bryobacteraceae bacterium]
MPSVAVSPDVRASLHEDGVVFLQLQSGAVFRSNRIGADIWKGLMDKQDLLTIASRIASESSVSPELVGQDVAQFVAQLKSNGFLVPSASRV